MTTIDLQTEREQPHAQTSMRLCTRSCSTAVRQRLLHPGFFANEDIAACSMPARLLFAGLWCIADREGRLEDRPKRIGLQLFPGDALDTDQLLDELTAAGLVARYRSGERALLCIPGFARFQHPHPKEPPSSLPAPDDASDAAVELHGNTAASPVKDDPSREKVSASPSKPSGSSGSSRYIALPNGKARHLGADQTVLDGFTEAWNGHCAPLPRLRKPPAGKDQQRLVGKAWEYFDASPDLLSAAVERCARDAHYREQGYGFEQFCRHVERWGEPVAPYPKGTAIVPNGETPAERSERFLRIEHAVQDRIRAGSTPRLEEFPLEDRPLVAAALANWG